jgi:hypothetical protein
MLEVDPRFHFALNTIGSINQMVFYPSINPASGCYSSKYAYKAFFCGAVTFEPWRGPGQM